MRYMMMLLACVTGFIVTTAHAQSWNTHDSSPLTFGQSFTQRIQVETFSFLASQKQCPEELTDFSSAFAHPRSACEIFITSSTPLIISDDIQKLLFLESLGIDGPISVKISPAFWSRRSLQELQIKNANLQSLPDEIGNLDNLVVLDLSDNALKTLPSSIGRLQKLQNLFLEGNSFSAEEQKKIRALLPHATIVFE